MFIGIFKLACTAIGFIILAIWIDALLESDGHCHMDDCDHCPWQGTCEEEERKHEDSNT